MAAPSGCLGRRGRLAAFALAAVALGPLVVALGLRPDARGYGTHEQLGLAPCPYRARTGRPCPWCGLTTASAHAVRGRLDRAWVANPAGCVYAVGALVVGVWLVRAGWSGRTWPARSLEGPVIAWVLAASAAGLAVWAVRDR
jgi:hypothetical protein